MDRLKLLIGRERTVSEVTRELFLVARSLNAAVVGAMHVHCADESEFETVNSFRKGFAGHLVPMLKLGHREPFQIANLGGRYEWGAVRIAESHFTTAHLTSGFKLMVVKVNSHVGLYRDTTGDLFGVLERYGAPSPCCDAIGALLNNETQPFANDFAESFRSEGRDRLEILRDPARVDPRQPALLAALVSARLEARRVMLDIQDIQPALPTLYVVVAGVTINRPGRDTEIVCGVYNADRRKPEPKDEYFGLGDDPSLYHVNLIRDRYQVEDSDSVEVREARDHRQLVLERWRQRRNKPAPQDERLTRIREDVKRDRHHDHRHAKMLLRIAIPVLAEVAPVPAAIILFAHGAVAMHHAYRAHQLANEVAGSDEARLILDEIHDTIDDLEPEKARVLIEQLMHEYE